jgi:hypothetical protein
MYEDSDNDNYWETNDTYMTTTNPSNPSNPSLEWTWTISTASDYNPINNSNYAKIYGDMFNVPSDAVTIFQNITNTNYKFERDNLYLNYYVQKYAQPLQVAILKILLGKTTPTEFAYNYSTGEITPNAETLLSDLKTEYSTYTTYIGIDKDVDIPKITDYLLDKVIGSQKFSDTDSNNYFSREDYKDIINQIIWEDALNEFYFSDENGQNSSLGSIYDTFPTNVIQDYSANSFFISSVEGESFAHIPSGEYQSLVMMPTEDNYLYEIWYFVVADRVLDIDVSYRYYDSTTGTYYQSTAKTVQTQVESTFDEGHAQILSINFYDNNNNETLFKTKNFNQNIGNGILQASTPKLMDYATSDYYKTLNSVNGFGTISVLDETKFVSDNSSFFEMVFDVHKDANNLRADYNFKIGMYGLFFASQSQINDYMLSQINN